MASEYIWLKFIHILIAIIALGTSAGLGFLLSFYADHPVHGVYVLRAIRRLLYLVVVPGYVLMPVTGLVLVHLSWSFTAEWIRVATGLWCAGAVLLALSVAAVRTQVGLLEAGGPASRAYRRISLAGRLIGGGLGLVVVAMLYLMVAKPGG